MRLESHVHWWSQHQHVLCVLRVAAFIFSLSVSPLGAHAYAKNVGRARVAFVQAAFGETVRFNKQCPLNMTFQNMSAPARTKLKNHMPPTMGYAVSWKLRKLLTDDLWRFSTAPLGKTMILKNLRSRNVSPWNFRTLEATMRPTLRKHIIVDKGASSSIHCIDWAHRDLLEFESTVKSRARQSDYISALRKFLAYIKSRHKIVCRLGSSKKIGKA